MGSLFLSDETPLQIITDSDDEAGSLGSDGEESSSVFNHMASTPPVASAPSENGHSDSNRVTGSGDGLHNRLTDTLTEAFIGNKKDQQIWIFNKHLKSMITKEVKKPGRSKNK